MASFKFMINIKSKREIELMRQSCQLAAKTLKYIEPFILPGTSTDKLNTLCHDFIVKHDAVPSPLNYHGFPKSICTSLNHVICHGIPSKTDILKEGDIVNVDVTTYLNKFHGDTNKTFFVGKVTPATKKLVEVTFECMMAGIAEVRPNAHIGNIGATIAKIAHANGYSVVEEYCGHGIGREFHEEPQVVHNNVRGTGVVMRPGMTFTIEPMINLGKRTNQVLPDGWTVVTKDRKLSAQFEHTILVTESSYEILTLLKEE